MGIGDHGPRLAAIRKRDFPAAKRAVIAMQKLGYKISYYQYYRLECGQWPTEEQVKIICKFFRVTPEYFLFGVNSDLLDNLNMEEREAAMLMIDRLIRARPPHNSF